MISQRVFVAVCHAAVCQEWAVLGVLYLCVRRATRHIRMPAASLP